MLELSAIVFVDYQFHEAIRNALCL